METAVKKLYEAMFLVDSAQASDWDAVVKTIENILKRSDVEIVAIRNWAERKLAYEIDQKSRATYVLCFFRADGSRIHNIEKDVQLSEKVLRSLILSTEARDEKDIEKDMHGTPDEKQIDDEDKDADFSSPQESEEEDVDIDDDDVDGDTESFEEPEAEEVRLSAAHDVSDEIEPPLSYKPEPDDGFETQTKETEEDTWEKDTAD